jgi:hypothetical protein
VSAWSSFFDEVNEAVDKYQEKYGETAIPFFRGQGDSSWHLQPGMLRTNCHPYYEQCMYYEFRAGAGMLIGHAMDSWDVAFSMQHYGLPTRILDWTETFSVALYFAITGMKNLATEEAAIWILDPYELNKETCGKDEILDLNDDFRHDYFTYFITDQREIEEFPEAVAVYPNRRNSRILAQKGIFTIHKEQKPLDVSFQRYVRKIVFKRDALTGGERFLELCGINVYTLFPELPGLCEHLKDRYKEHLVFAERQSWQRTSLKGE